VRVLKNMFNHFGLTSYLTLAFLCCLFVGTHVNAATVEFPSEELSQETVLPVFDQPTAVKKRIVPLEHRLGLGFFGGIGLNDPFFSPIVFGGTAAYNFTNEMGVEFLGASYSRTPSQYDAPIKNATQSDTGQPCTANCPDFSFAPSVSRLMFLNFKWTPFYGKISLAKSAVMNLMTNFYIGLGGVTVGDQTPIGGSLGLGQEFYFSSNFGIRVDLRSFIYSGPYAASKHILYQNPTSTPPNSSFDQQTTVGILFDVGAVFLL
jgi:outer membrane beta-barrel protein